jgi:hypothetical protein
MLKSPDDINPAKRPSSARENIYELTLFDLDAATGGRAVKQSGNLAATCCKGTHIPKVTIEMW